MSEHLEDAEVMLPQRDSVPPLGQRRQTEPGGRLRLRQTSMIAGMTASSIRTIGLNCAGTEHGIWRLRAIFVALPFAIALPSWPDFTPTSGCVERLSGSAYLTPSAPRAGWASVGLSRFKKVRK